MHQYQLQVTDSDLLGQSVEDIFQRLITAGNGGTVVRSTAAPALSTQFVKSKMSNRAHAGTPGAFAEISYPSLNETASKLETRHAKEISFGYVTTRGSATNPGGFGERSARALAREENTYQFKGTFPSAMLSFSKLRARVEARHGDIRSVERVFARMWGLSEDAVAAIPHLHLSGSEATRLAAMEDRAYHALSGHPGHHGGYRVDMATVTSDAFGESVPLNWPRMRTGLKAIAEVQFQGDLQMENLIIQVQAQSAVKFGMDVVEGSQPQYIRPSAWELIVDRLMELSPEDDHAVMLTEREGDPGFAISSTFNEAMVQEILNVVDLRMGSRVQELAALVTDESNKALVRTIEVILEHDADRAMIDVENEDTHGTLEKSRLSASFDVPKYKLTRSSLSRGIMQRTVGPDNLPDITAHGKLRRELDMREFREAGLEMPLDLPGALHMAVFVAAQNPQNKKAMYQLLTMVPTPDEPERYKSAVRLRKSELYESESIHMIGKQIFNASFRGTLELLFGNMVSREAKADTSIKKSIWAYLNGRCKVRRECPVVGGWRDLMVEILDMPESWSLYYWARVCIGKRHREISGGMLAEITAGQTVDFLSLIRRNIKERIKSWEAHYTAQYTASERALAERTEAQRRANEALQLKETEVDENEEVARYIPPHLRRIANLAVDYAYQEAHEGAKLSSQEEYQRMVEMQSKAKFFAMIQVSTHNNRISVGVTDSAMQAMLIEFYHARWWSLDRRLKKALANFHPFRLGRHIFVEHPWGEFITEYPETYEDTLQMMMDLDPRGWTVEPAHLQDKFKKSISELWGDIRREIIAITDYINDMHEDLVEDQEEVLKSRPSAPVLSALSDVPAIPLQVAGYIAPYRLPVRNTTVFDEGEEHQLRMPVNRYIETQETDELSTSLPELDLDGMSFDMSSFDLGNLAPPPALEVEETDYLTYREIWHRLALPEVPDNRIVYAFGLPADTDIDIPHHDSMKGPLVSRMEAALTSKKWGRKRNGLLHRIGMLGPLEMEEDM